MVDKVRENLARRVALRQGLFLSKSGRRDPRALDFEHYYLKNIETGLLANATAGFIVHTLTIEDVEQMLCISR